MRRIEPFAATVVETKDAEHFFAPGTKVRITYDNHDPQGRWEAHRWLAWGPHRSHPDRRIQQWLSADEFE